MPPPPEPYPDPAFVRLRAALAALALQHQRDISDLFEEHVAAFVSPRATPDEPPCEELAFSHSPTSTASEDKLISLNPDGGVQIAEPARGSSLPPSPSGEAMRSMQSIRSGSSNLSDANVMLSIGERRRTPLSMAKVQTKAASTAPPISGKTWSQMMQHASLLTRLVSHKAYELCVMLLIVGNAASIGLELQDNAISSEKNQFPDTAYHRNVEVLFVFVFSIELTLRMCAYKKAFFFNSDWHWNCFDTVVVVGMWAEEMFRVSGSEDSSGFLSQMSVLRILRVARVIRILRVIRVLRFFRELRLMLTSILNSMMSLVWALLLMGILFYVFGLYIMQGVVDFLGDNAAWQDPRYEGLAKHFGRLDRSVMSLFEAMAGGISWGELVEDLQHVSWKYTLIFLSFISVAVLVVMNIVTGVFVQTAMERSSDDRESLIQDSMHQKEGYLAKVNLAFQEMDDDNSGTLSFDELERSMQDERMSAYFDALGLNAEDIDTLFVLLDRDGTGQIDVQEFLVGCMKLKGEAKGFDVAVIQYQNKWIMHNLAERGRLSPQRHGGNDQKSTSHQCG